MSKMNNIAIRLGMLHLKLKFLWQTQIQGGNYQQILLYILNLYLFYEHVKNNTRIARSQSKDYLTFPICIEMCF